VLPADNLYKFIALTGLVLALWSLTYPVGKLAELELALAEADSLQQKRDIEAAEIGRVLENLEKERSRLQNLKPQDSERARQTEAELSALIERHVQNQIKLADLRKSAEVVKVQRKWVKYYSRAVAVGVGLGILLVLVGLLLWFGRVQRRSDQLLLKQRGKSPFGGDS
jgi:hypothetical protein